MTSPTIIWMASSPRNVTMTREKKSGIGGKAIFNSAVYAIAFVAAVAALAQFGAVL